MQTIENIIDYCNNYSVSPRTKNEFDIDVGKKICKYLLGSYNQPDYFYHGLANFFYGSINDRSVIITKEMFKQKEYTQECYKMFILKNNIRCINCINCIDCIDCTDCIDCRDCVACDSCNICSKCSLCVNCLRCDHCVQSKYTADSSSLHNENNSLLYNL